MAQLFVFISAKHHWPYVHSITERSSSSTYSKCCWNLQADHHSQISLSYSRFLTHLKVIHSSIQVSNILVLTVRCKLNIVFQIFLLFIPERPTRSRFNCSEYARLFRLDPITTAIWFVSFELIIFSSLRWTVAYASSIHNNVNSLWQKFWCSL
jgi:hypothetical protein